MANLLLEHPRFDTADLTSVQLCSVGSAPLAPYVLERLQERMPTALVSNNYGMTEAGSVYCLMPPGEAVKRPGSVGKPVPPAEILCADDDGQPVPAGEVGNVRMRIPGRPREYYGDPEASSEDLGGRMAGHRRPGQDRRRRLSVHRRPEQGCDHPGWQQHPSHRRGERHRPPPGGPGGGGGGPPPPGTGARTYWPWWHSALVTRPRPTTCGSTPWSAWPSTRCPASGSSSTPYPATPPARSSNSSCSSSSPTARPADGRPVRAELIAVKVTRTLHHSVNVEGQLDEAVAFYQAPAGTGCDARPEIPGDRRALVRRRTMPSSTSSMPTPGHQAIQPAGPHVCFAVEDLPAAIAELEAVGHPLCAREHRVPWSRSGSWTQPATPSRSSRTPISA